MNNEAVCNGAAVDMFLKLVYKALKCIYISYIQMYSSLKNLLAQLPSQIDFDMMKFVLVLLSRGHLC